MAKAKFAIGQHVAERPRLYGSCATTPEGIQEYTSRKQQRYGVVVDILTQSNTRGAKRNYIKVKWNHNNSVSTHDQMRLCPIEELQSISNATRELIDF